MVLAVEKIYFLGVVFACGSAAPQVKHSIPETGCVYLCSFFRVSLREGKLV